MKTRLITIIIIGCLATAVGVIPAFGDESPADPQMSYYIKCINDEIDHYSCKVTLTSSRSKNLQAYGEQAALKTVFLSRNRDALVREMTAKKVSMHPQAVQQYLRQRFNQETTAQLAVNP
jgi:uncharacterized membrane protein YbaN (DUF454 family)